eukprot:jgi/Bigna1/142126/aug1.67_g16834
MDPLWRSALVLLIVHAVLAWTEIERREAEGLRESLITMRRNYHSLSYAEFRNSYKMTKTPVIITNYTDGWPIMNWSFDRLKEDCVGDRVNFVDKGLYLIQNLPPAAKKMWEAELMRVFGLSLNQLLRLCQEGMSVPQFIDYVTLNRSKEEIMKQDFSHLVYGGVYDPEIFFAAAHSRAYPAHLHGVSADILLLVVRGRKKYVGWPYTEKENLYRFELGGDTEQHTETSDEIFLAEGIRPDFASQPLLKDTVGWEGEVKEGDLLYIPCGQVHQVENLEPTFSLTFRVVDGDVVQCSKELQELGAHTIEMQFLDLLTEKSRERAENDPPVDWSSKILKEEFCPELSDWNP